MLYDAAQPDVVAVSALARDLVPALTAWLAAAPVEQLSWHHSAQPLPHAATEAEYTALVRTGVAAIEEKEVVKVVTSRAARRALPTGFDPLAAFDDLSQKYPQAFVSLVSVPGVGTWLGATPEILAEVTADGTFRTMALAATQPLTADVTPRTAIWRQKEIEEQALVARYIVSCFKQLRLREYHETGPRTVIAGQPAAPAHRLRGEPAARAVPVVGHRYAAAAAPTSAVGGMPKVAAMAFLNKHEGYDRAYYSGFLGPVNVAAPGIARLYVNLRCLQLHAHEAVLYAGTGLTVDSDPEREWQETEMKLQTVGTVIAAAS
ncbi:chorismate-binding protein [Hymenobacter humi]|uniref:Chorismate-binding protein n=1 Tax=Hymenobacter humi TaxID=1411620 RepID=A0ABW2U4F0_9BACT